MSDGLPSNWYQQGDAPEPAPLIDRGDRKRFWLKSDQEDIITIIDDDPFRIWEHDAQVAGRWGNRFTCVNGLGEGFDPCPGCSFRPRSKRPKRYRVGFVTIVSEREFEYQGRAVKNLKRLFPMKGDLLKKFSKYKEDFDGSLIGMRIRVWRTGPRTFTVGDDWVVKDRIPGVTAETDPVEARKIISLHYEFKDAEGVPLLYEPYDYVKMLSPQPRKQIIGLIGTEGETGIAADTDDVDTAGSASTPGAPVGQHVDF